MDGAKGRGGGGDVQFHRKNTHLWKKEKQSDSSPFSVTLKSQENRNYER